MLIEWPERAPGALPADRIDIALSHRPALGSTARAAVITGHGKAAAQVERLKALREFLDGAGFTDAKRQRMPGDASTRSYARLARNDGFVILMNSPKRPDGPAIYDGGPYSAAVHLAEDVKPFVAIANGLRERGFSAPKIHQADLDVGLLITEDFGSARFRRGRSARADRGALSGRDRHAGGAAPSGLARNTVAGAADHLHHPPFDTDAMLVELGLDAGMVFAGSRRRHRRPNCAASSSSCGASCWLRRRLPGKPG